MFGLDTSQKGLKTLNGKQRLQNLVRSIGGSVSDVYTDFTEQHQYAEGYGPLDIRITNSDSFTVPWIDIFHNELGPVALYRVTDDEKAAEMLLDYKETFGETTATDD